jgi:hypothetical protein
LASDQDYLGRFELLLDVNPIARRNSASNAASILIASYAAGEIAILILLPQCIPALLLPLVAASRISCKFLKFCHPSRTRTCDHSINSRMIYQLNYVESATAGLSLMMGQQHNKECLQAVFSRRRLSMRADAPHKRR